jgi:hypothetical protein
MENKISAIQEAAKSFDYVATRMDAIEFLQALHIEGFDIVVAHTPLCVSCGCSGNEGCGCKPIDTNGYCALNEVLMCCCCSTLGKVENMKRWKSENCNEKG